MRFAFQSTEPPAANRSLEEDTDHYSGGTDRAGKAADTMPTREQIRDHTQSNAAALEQLQSGLLAHSDAATVVMRDGEVVQVLDDWDSAFDWAEQAFADGHFSVHQISRTPAHVPFAVLRS